MNEDLSLAEDLARRAGQAIENARLYEERDHIAHTLQQSLLPPELPDISGVELAARYLPAGEGNEVGGDFYDVFETGSGSWGVAIGDVCGKGAVAAAVMGLARYTLRAAAMREDRPSRILQTLNEAVMRQTTDGRFITVCYARVRPNPRAARLTVDAVALLGSMRENAAKLNMLTEEIIRLEDDTDTLNDNGIKALFKRHRDGNAMTYIVGTEVYGHLERVMDRFEDVAHRISGLVIEQM